MKNLKTLLASISLMTAMLFAPLSFAEPEKPFNINTATVAQLDELVGVGPKKARAIKAHIEKNGKFTNASDLVEVSGIGPKTLAKNLEFILVK